MMRDWDLRVQKRSAAAVDLLSRATVMLRIEVSSMIECHSQLVGDGERTRPVPGTVAADVADDIAAMLDLIREIEAHLMGEKGAKPIEGPVGWLDDVIARRNGWEGGL